MTQTKEDFDRHREKFRQRWLKRNLREATPEQLKVRDELMDNYKEAVAERNSLSELENKLIAEQEELIKNLEKNPPDAELPDGYEWSPPMPSKGAFKITYEKKGTSGKWDIYGRKFTPRPELSSDDEYVLSDAEKENIKNKVARFVQIKQTVKETLDDPDKGA